MPENGLRHTQHNSETIQWPARTARSHTRCTDLVRGRTGFDPMRSQYTQRHWSVRSRSGICLPHTAHMLCRLGLIRIGRWGSLCMCWSPSQAGSSPLRRRGRMWFLIGHCTGQRCSLDTVPVRCRAAAPPCRCDTQGKREHPRRAGADQPRNQYTQTCLCRRPGRSPPGMIYSRSARHVIDTCPGHTLCSSHDQYWADEYRGRTSCSVWRSHAHPRRCRLDRLCTHPDQDSVGAGRPHSARSLTGLSSLH